MPSEFFYIAGGFCIGVVFLWAYIRCYGLNWKKEIEKIFDEVEEGFEGTAVEFCEKHGDASYTGFKEGLKILKERFKEKGMI